MLNSRLLFMTAMISFSALGSVSFEEKKNRVEYLEELTQSTSMNIEAYKRELEYEKQGLELETRAEHETNLLAEKIKLQVQRAYEAALDGSSAEEATALVKEAIEKDLELVAPELKEELKELSLNALTNAQSGVSNSDMQLKNIQGTLLKGVQERSAFLNEEAAPLEMSAMTMANNDNRDAERKEYKNKEEIIESLVSDRANVRWVSTSNMTLDSGITTTNDSRISLQVKVSFLGVAVDAGPTIAFKRSYNTKVVLGAEGLNPVLLSNGNFDFHKRDKQGTIIVKGGKSQKRFINMTCEAELEFATDYTGQGGFSVAGIGASTAVTRQFKNSVKLNSRRIMVPEYVAGRTFTYREVTELCHRSFLRGRVTNNMNVAGSLNVMMKNVVSSLRFSHPKTKCAVDSHCYNWYNKEVLGIVKIKNFPRCVEERREKYRACELRGLTGQNCAVFDKSGKRVSDGMFEFTCDKGLKCVKVQNEGWFVGFNLYQYAKGRCSPINSRTYRSPYDKGYIEVQLVN